MLVLTRKAGESVSLKIGDVTVIVKLLKANDGKAKLGFDAPKEVVIMRTEIDS